MAIPAICSCGKRFGAPEKYAGKRVKCPDCRNPLQIPRAQSARSASKSSDAPAKLRARCSCGGTFTVRQEFAGRTVKCPNCQQAVKIPATSGASKASARQAIKPPVPETAPPDAADELFDELGIGIGGSQTGRRCPECKAAMAEEAVICIACGYNENLGRKMQTIRPTTHEDRTAARAGRGGGSRVPRAKSKSRGGSGGQLVQGVLPVAILLILGLGGLAFVSPAIAMPLLGLTSIVAMFGGGLWLLGVAFTDSPLQGVLCVFVPFYAWIYILMNWEDCKGPFLLQLAGFVLWGLNVALIINR